MKRSTVKISLALALVMGLARVAVAFFPMLPVRRCGADAVVGGWG